MTTDSTPSMRHFTTEAFGAGDRIAACHDVYGRTIAKIDLQPALRRALDDLQQARAA